MPNSQHASIREQATATVAVSEQDDRPKGNQHREADSSRNRQATQRQDRQLRICLVGYRSNPHTGGQGAYLKYLSQALVDAGQLVDVVSGPPYPILDKRVRLIQLPSLDLYAASNHVTALRPEHLLSFTDSFEYFGMLTGGFPEVYTFGRRLVKFIRQHGRRYDVIHDNQSLSYGILKLQKEGWPIVSTLHHPITRDQEIALESVSDWGSRLLVRRWYSFLHMQKQVLRKLHNLIAVSEFSRQDFARSFGTSAERIRVVHNSVDTTQFRPLPWIQRSEQQLIAVASADVPLKGVSYLLRALAELRPHWPRLRLTLVSPLKEDGATARLIRELDIKDCVEVVSNLSSEELASRYAQATLAVVPSLYEGFGMPAGEAMACGLPVVSTNGGALPEVVGDAGLIIPRADASSLAAAIDRLMRNPSLREQLSKAGLERVRRHFSQQVYAEKMLACYRKAFGLCTSAAACR